MAHQHALLLLNPGLFFAPIGTGAIQLDAGLVLLAPLLQRRLEECPVVVHFDAPHGEEQQLLEHLQDRHQRGPITLEQG